MHINFLLINSPFTDLDRSFLGEIFKRFLTKTSTEAKAFIGDLETLPVESGIAIEVISVRQKPQGYSWVAHSSSTIMFLIPSEKKTLYSPCGLLYIK